MVDLTFLFEAIASVFVVVNPIGNVPIFYSLTSDYDDATKRRIVLEVVWVTLGALILFGLLGEVIFEIYGISLPAFEIAGGILLFSTSFSMLHGENPRSKTTSEEQSEAMERESIGIVPLGIPLFAGPGAITTVIIFSGRAHSFVNELYVIVAISITAFASYIALAYATPIFKKLGRMGAMALSRIEGILLAALAIQFIITGMTAVAHSLL
ncbi:MAG: NAAT family transporter [Methanomassiliicoccales archaeon]